MENERYGILSRYDEDKERLIIEAITFDVDHELSLQEMYNLLDCDIVEPVKLIDGINIWVDEEGFLKTGNPKLEYIVSEERRIHLAGKALFLSADRDKETIGLSQEQVEWFLNNIEVKLCGSIR